MTLFIEKVLVSNRCISDLMSNLIKESWTDSCAILAFLKGIVRQEFLLLTPSLPFNSEIVGTVCQIKPGDSFKLIRKLILRWNSFWSSIFSLKALGKKKIYFENERQRNFQCGWFVELYWQVVWLMDFRISWLVDIYWLIGWFLKFGDWVIFILDSLKSVHFKNKVTRSSFHSKQWPLSILHQIMYYWKRCVLKMNGF